MELTSPAAGDRHPRKAAAIVAGARILLGVDHRRLVLTAAALVALGVGIAAARPAVAHPFGPPPTAEVSADGAEITVDWSATPDDAVAIGELLGLMPEGSTAAYRQESAAQVAPSRADEAAFSASAQLHDYLTEHIVVLQRGAPCAATVPPIEDFVHAGARVVLTCPEPVTQVDLRITMLHSLHPAYRTFAVGEGSTPAEAVFTPEAPQHTWRFGTAADADDGSLSLGYVAAGAAVVAGLGGAVMARRRRSTS